MYGTLRVHTCTSDVILRFVRSYHKYSDILWTCHKIFEHACECVNWHHILYVQNTHVWYTLFFRRVPYCSRRASIDSVWTNFAQHTHWLPQSTVSSAAFLESYSSLYSLSFLFKQSSSGSIIVVNVFFMDTKDNIGK